MPENESKSSNGEGESGSSDRVIHPAWIAFVRYCHELKHGEIACLKIQDGLPVLAEVTRRKIKFT